MIENVAIHRQKFVNDPDVPHDGCEIICKNKRYFHALPSGRHVYSQTYAKVEHYQNGHAWVCGKNGRWKIIDKQGKPVTGKPTSLIFG